MNIKIYNKCVDDLNISKPCDCVALFESLSAVFELDGSFGALRVELELSQNSQ
jgi:hypothetical protein